MESRTKTGSEQCLVSFCKRPWSCVFTTSYKAKLKENHVAAFLSPQTLESVDVHCFGHLLYEMTYGRPPDSVPVDSFPPAPSMAVGQYGFWRSLLGPGSLQSYSPPPESRKDPEEVAMLP